ncbi:RNA polymerase sigma factor SigX [Halobacillus litoralis]|uniref:RNA polymerase sigma factor SigX n=1 Tax=Halobacillus litoralis TaxID=45668 RepID=UPI001CFE4116|nr:RNA polymerase sigma factor SigX [Halobacillus litoralis]
MKQFFDEFYENYHQDLFQFIMYMVKDRSLAEDLVQDVYVKVLKSYDSFSGKSTEKTWLFSIARHVIFDYFRKQKRKRNRILGFFDWHDKGDELKDQHPVPEELIVQNEEIQQVYDALDHCSVNQRSVLVLRYIQELTIKETAEVTGWSESKVKTTQHRAIRTIKALMENQEEGSGNHEETKK